jgi:hypothetical protein
MASGAGRIVTVRSDSAHRPIDDRLRVQPVGDRLGVEPVMIFV